MIAIWITELCVMAFRVVHIDYAIAQLLRFDVPALRWARYMHDLPSVLFDSVVLLSAVSTSRFARAPILC